MSRSGYYEGDCDDNESLLAAGRWNAQIKSAIRGKRGQKFLLDLVAALDALPEKKLIANDLQREGSFCALGALAHHRAIKVDIDRDDDDDWEDSEWAKLGSAFDIAEQLARETMFINDETARTDEDRWQYVRRWALRNLRPETLIGKPETMPSNEGED